ncbi:hypothetical protein pkur_cds_316 [Pandoravirus kuranda]|uniref:Uncharacterized protein n=1 Tax=Pandoravirus kuranda TaxID=3019033 RepID=A0AA95J7K9_9VIRU|nr:hypothetical protein pkur_cds_316 [Pandoravirus kuranda]
MCYSQPMSAVLAIGGWAIVAWLVIRRRGVETARVPPLVYPYAFYALMETLQALQYSVLDQCGRPVNYALTLVAHVLVAVQPCMWNLYRLARARAAVAAAARAVDVRETQRQRDAAAVFAAAAGMSAVWAVFFTIRLLPPNPVRGVLPATATFTTMHTDEIMVGPEVCTMGGPTHLFWVLPYAARNGLEANFFAYLLLWFYPALHEPRGALKLAYWMAQVVLVNVTAGSIHELPTVWCALSVPILLLILYFDRADLFGARGPSARNHATR